MTSGLKEAAQLRDRQEFAQKCIRLAQTLDGIFDTGFDLLGEWEHKDFASSFTEADIASFPFDLADLQAFVGMLSAIRTMATGGAPVQANYLQVNTKLK